MSARYTATCDDRDVREAAYRASTDSARQPTPSLENTDPDLAILIRALDHARQQVRDVAAYTIGLLGPGAKDAIPFLSLKFSYEESKGPDTEGGWFNFAYGRVACEDTVAPDISRVIPAAMLPPRDPESDYQRRILEFVTKLYRNPENEYPPDLLTQESGSFTSREAVESGEAVFLVPRLAEILAKDGLSDQKHREAADVLARMGRAGGEHIKGALLALLTQTRSPSFEVRLFVGYALVRLHRPEGIPLLMETLGINDFADSIYDWPYDLCGMGHAAISAEDKLLSMARYANWQANALRAIRVLGCIGSTKAIPLLISMLREPDWMLNAAAARALGTIGTASQEAVPTLTALAARHWSGRVRKAATEALEKIAGKPSPPPSGTTIETVWIGGGPKPYDHGLPWCDDSGRYSVDGRQWFRVQWIKPAIGKEPGIVPKRLLQTRGTQIFLEVDDGWLMGSDGFEGRGFLVHVSRDGSVQDFAGGSAPYYNASIQAIVRIHGKYFAVGSEFRRGTYADLLALARAKNGTWSSERVVALPSVPTAYAISPRGDLLLSDEANKYAVIGRQIVPLRCEKLMQGRYFDEHPGENDWD